MTSRIKKCNHDPSLISKFVAYKHQKHRIKYNLKGRIKKKNKKIFESVLQKKS